MENNESKNLPLRQSPNLKSTDDGDIEIIRIRFSRIGATAYLAHLDMMRIFERTILRAGINCDHTQGFNPRPIMVFALPLGVGVESLDDYLDLTVKGKTNPSEVVSKLKKVLPPGMDILGASIAPKSKESIMAKVCAAQYLFLLNGIERLTDIIMKFDELTVEKKSKGKLKIINAKSFILSAKSDKINSMEIIVKAGSKENLRPDLLLESLVGMDGFTSIDAKNTQIIRTGTFIKSDDDAFIRPM